MTNIISRFCRIKKVSSADTRIVIRTNDGEESMDSDWTSVYKHVGLDYPKFFKMDDLSKYGILAADYLFKGYNWKEGYADTDIGIILSNASGSLDTDVEFNKTINNKELFFPSPAIFVYTLSNIVMGEICIRHKIKGENLFLLSETLPAEQLTNYAVHLLEVKNTRAVVVGWAEYKDGVPDVLLMYVEKHDSRVKDATELSARQIELLYR